MKAKNHHLRIQPILLPNLPNRYEALGRHLTRRNPRHDTKRPIPLDIRQKSIIGILVLMVFGTHNMFVIPITSISIRNGLQREMRNEQTGQYAPHSRFTYFTTNIIRFNSAGRHNLLEFLKLLHSDNSKQIRARHGEMRAEVVGECMSGFTECRGEYTCDLAEVSVLLGLGMDWGRTKGIHPPQPVPALVRVLTSPRVVHPWFETQVVTSALATFYGNRE